MNSMFARKPSRFFGLARRASGALALLIAAAVPQAALAQSAGADALPKGYTSDELPALPPSKAQAAPVTPAQAQEAPVEPADAQVTVEATASAEYYEDTDPSALSDFREPLSPYGTWVEDATYGTVWVPSAVVVGADFAPYQTSGHWEMTAEGDWLWVSDYQWGHIPFHYGRWVWIAGRGWSWIPGRVYAPAWVTWRTSEYGYIGWAPMPPGYYWSSGVAVSIWATPPAAYVFCPTTHVFHHHVHTYVVRDHSVVRRIGAHSRPYKAAQASAGGGGGSAQSKAPAGPGGSASATAPGGQHRRYEVPKGPTLAEARVPPGAAPKVRASHDERALAFSTRSGTARAKSLPPSARGLNAAPGREAPSRGFDAFGRERSQPATRIPRGFDRGAGPQPHVSPQPQRSFQPPSQPQRSFQPQPQPQRSFQPPSPQPQRSFQPSPQPQRSFQPSPQPQRSFQPPAPTRVAPSSPSPRSVQPSATPSRRSAPSASPSPAPAARPSAPTRSSPSTSSKPSSSSSSSKSSSSKSRR